MKSCNKDSRWFLESPIIHRGLHNIHDGVLEHSQEALRRAIKAGLPIEIDLVSSRDQENFVIHDFILDNLTNGTGNIPDLLAEEVRQYRLKDSFAGPILTLDELLNMVNHRVPLMVEFKSREPYIIPSIKSACLKLNDYGGRCSVQSFNPLILEWVAAHYPHFTLGLLTTNTDLLDYRNQYIVSMMRSSIKYDYIAHHLLARNCWMFQWILETDIPLLAFTVRNNNDWEVAKQFADNMFFEFIEPDIRNWKTIAEVGWRSNIGETVDRTNSNNLPPVEAMNLDDGPPWWR